MVKKGTLYLVPVPLGETAILAVIPASVQQIVATLDYFIVEHPKTARHFLKQFGTNKPLQAVQLLSLNEHTQQNELIHLLEPLLNGHDVGLMSEAGCPAVADPGSALVKLAHHRHIRVVPLVGPSSILLALMASGMNGQRFCFHGYLPANPLERKATISQLEKKSAIEQETQIFIETPYRNLQMLETIVATCQSTTQLCIASDLTLASELIISKPISEWRSPLPEIHKKPTIFLLQA